MDIRQALLAEHSKRQTTAIVEYIGDDTDRFAVLMQIFFAGDYRLTQRVAWPMSYCAETHRQYPTDFRGVAVIWCVTRFAITKQRVREKCCAHISPSQEIS